MREVARRRGITQRNLIEEAVRIHLTADTAARTEADIAPLINQLLQDQHQALGKGLRSLIVRIGQESLRTQYLVLNFLVRAGMTEGEVESWREAGWRYANRELKVKPTPDADGTEP